MKLTMTVKLTENLSVAMKAEAAAGEQPVTC